MALHPDFPGSPHDILDPSIRWFPADEDAREKMHELMPPLVAELRRKIKEWRDRDYAGASDTSRALLTWWFKTEHMMPQSDGTLAPFQYYFAQREALETIIWLYEVAGAQSPYDLMRYDSSGFVNQKMFDESWARYVIKMATGSGKTKVMSLALTWSYFHKMYEAESDLSRNFLVVAPNIIVLDRIRDDFDGLKIFFEDPVLPDNGYAGQNWRDDFQLRVHIQDDVRVVEPTGNIFLTNIHRVYDGRDTPPSLDDDNTMDYFLGPKVTGKTTDSSADLGLIVRDIDELMVINDEAHHIHDKSLAWFKSIQDIHNGLLQKGQKLSLQVDVTATPKHNNGAIFVQTVSDYPLVEAISQNVVKHPVLPDQASRAKLTERQSSKFTEKYADYIDLGVIEWRKAYETHEKLSKKAILFIMTDDTKNCDDVAEYLENRHGDLAGQVLTIHTNSKGVVSEAQSKAKLEELNMLREQANNIDSWDSPYKAIVSVLMLKEGWDTKNVTTIVGLRAYSAKSNILPEQTLGRGLRKMYPGNTEEYVSVIGTDAFMDFVEQIQAEGVELERSSMGAGAKPKAPLIVEVDEENESKDLEALDIQLPVLTRRNYRNYKNLDDFNPSDFAGDKITLKQFSEDEQREIVFKDITTGHVTHTTSIDSLGIADFRSLIGYFTQSIMAELRLKTGYDALYPKVKAFIRDDLFGQVVDLEDANVHRNLSVPETTHALIETFKRGINHLTVEDKGNAEINGYIKLRDTKPYVAKQQPYIPASKSVFNYIIGDSGLELQFAKFLEDKADVKAYAKNYIGVGFKLDYQKADGSLAEYYPDFFVKDKGDTVYIVETKGQEDVDVEPKRKRLEQWCEDVNAAQSNTTFKPLFVKQGDFEKHKFKDFAEAAAVFDWTGAE